MGLDVYVCIALMGVLATLYTVLGGIEAVIWTDVIQAVVLVAGALLAYALVIYNVDGGAATIIETASAANKFHAFEWTWDYTVPAVWVILIGNIFSNAYPATADQTMVQRYLTTATTRDAQKAIYVHAVVTIPITLLFFSLGTALWVYFKFHPENLDPTQQADAVFPQFVIATFPTGLRGILIAGVLAAAMSSLDSSINSVASVLTNDYYRRFRTDGDEAHYLRVARWITVVFGACGTGAALWVAGRETGATLWMDFLSYLGLVGGGLAGVFALGVFTKRATGSGALIGAVVSAVVLLFFKQTPAHPHLYGLVGLTTAFVVGYGASLVLKTREK